MASSPPLDALSHLRSLQAQRRQQQLRHLCCQQGLQHQMGIAGTARPGWAAAWLACEALRSDVSVLPAVAEGTGLAGLAVAAAEVDRALAYHLLAAADRMRHRAACSVEGSDRARRCVQERKPES